MAQEKGREDILKQHEKVRRLSKIMAILRRTSILSTIAFFAISIILIILFLNSDNPGEALKYAVLWIAISMFLMLVISIVTAAFSGKFSRYMAATNIRAKENHIISREIINSITKKYSAIYCIDRTDNSVAYIQQTERLQGLFGEITDISKGFDWYIEKYCDRFVMDEYRDTFMRKACLSHIIERLQARPYYTFRYQADLNGKPNYFEMCAVRVDDELNMILIGFVDVDEEVREEKARTLIVRESLDQVSLANSAKDKVMSNISHELLTPLNEVLGLASLMAVEETDMETVTENAGKISAATQKVVNLINDIMYSNAISNGEMMVHEKQGSLSETLDLASRNAAEEALRKKIRINRFYSISHDRITFDEEKVRTIFERLFNLAVKFSEPDTIIDFEAKEATEVNDKIMYEFRIVVYGAGISDEYVRRILEDENLLKADASSSGMSLSIAKRLTELMSGTMTIKCEDGRGTVAVIRFFFKT